MTATRRSEPNEAWDVGLCESLIEELWGLRRAMVDHAQRLGPWLKPLDARRVPSAINFAHYLALRRTDLRPIQERLSWMGVSSLGRAETHVLASLDKVLGILHRLAGQPWEDLADEEPVGSRRGPALLESHANGLLGKAPAGRSVRIMVTLPSEAATDDTLVASLVDAGMDIARINCAHDTATQWAAMAKRVHKAARRSARTVRILMDLGGPKLRTGPIADEQGVVKLRPQRDALGRVEAPALLALRPVGSLAVPESCDAVLGVEQAWFAGLEVGDRIGVCDARQAQRRMIVTQRHADCALVECAATTYLTADTRLRHKPRHGLASETRLHDIPVAQGVLHLKRGDRVHVVSEGIGHDARVPATGHHVKPATIACTLPQALDKARKGQRIWFDDGRIGGVILKKRRGTIEVEITNAREGGERLAADKGINLPDTALDLPALTDKDMADLVSVAKLADLVGLSFCQSAADVRQLQSRLAALGAERLGVVLKIETRRGFEHLPEMLMTAMSSANAGVMIARGDLAVECGYERMAEVQEEILWACEAAHIPVIWATQVLESLAKTGLPSRAEITDAAMGERAECVMLNKGPHIVDAMRTLDDILQRMQAHQSKKKPLLRALKSWARIPDSPVR